MTYVHEDCILDWITKKIEASDRVEIPSCEICHEKYSARMKIGKKKICPNILLDKIKQLPNKDKAITLMHSLVFLIVAVTLFIFIFDSLSGQFFRAGGLKSFTLRFYLEGVSQFYVLCACIKHFHVRNKMLEESMIQIVEVTLQPKVALRC